MIVKEEEFLVCPYEREQNKSHRLYQEYGRESGNEEIYRTRFPPTSKCRRRICTHVYEIVAYNSTVQ